MSLSWRIARTVATFAAVLIPISVHAGGRAHSSAGVTPHRWQSLVARPAVGNPSAIAIDLRGDRRLNKWGYTADASTQRIVKFSTNGKVLGSWQYGDAKNRGVAAGVAVGGTGNVFVADPAMNRVSKFGPDGKLLAQWGGFQAPRGIAVDRSGDIFVTEYAPHRVTKLSSSGTVLKQWDTFTVWGGGSTGSPTGVAIKPPDSIYVSTTCSVGVTCGIGLQTNPHAQMVDGLLEFLSQGLRQGYVMEIWFGIGHSIAGSPQDGPAKESEPFVTIDAVTNDAGGNLYVGGLLWERGEKPARGVLVYTPFGYKWGRWNLPSQSRIHGVAVDSLGNLYVSQDRHILKLTRKA